MFYKITNKINNNIIKNNKFIITNLNKNELFFTKKLIKLNVIKYIYKLKNKFLIILKLFKKNKLIFKIKNMYKPSKLKILNLKTINKINNNKIYLINTNKGILNNFECIKKKLGGILITILWN